MKKKLYIIGAGSVGGHLAVNIDQYSKSYEVAGFFDDDPQKIGTRQFGFEVLGGVGEVSDLRNSFIVLGIAFPDIKKKLLKKIAGNETLRFPSLVHEKAWISNDVSLGKGCIIYPGTTINFRSEIKDFVVINVNCSLGHHTHVGSYSSLAPGVNTGGHTYIQEAVDIGIGVSTIQDINIGEGSTIGGQSMIIRDVQPGSKVAGVPAKVIT